MNKIILSGIVTTEPQYSYEIFGEKFYIFYIESARNSNRTDTLRCIASEAYLPQISQRGNIKVFGEIRTRNVKDGAGKTHLEINVFVNEIYPYGEFDENFVEIDGFVCKETTCRTTPFGRKISDILIACNRKFGRSDYIPAISWGRNAIKSSLYEVGARIVAEGRLQSRWYTKKIEIDGEIKEEERIAYEISISRISEVSDGKVEENETDND